MTRGRAVAVGAGCAAAAWSWPAPLPLAPRLAHRIGVPSRLDPPRGVALTFDDGPHPHGTPAVLDALDAAGAVATFFLVGEQVARYPTIPEQIVAAGHEIGLHGYRHRLLLRRSMRALAADLDHALDLIVAATGREPTCYRPPYGVFSSGALRLVRELGLTPLLWSRWGRDWGEHETPAAIARRATRDLTAGDVVLLHDADHYSAPDSWRRTVAALPAVLDAVRAIGEPFVAASDSTYRATPSANVVEGRQPSSSHARRPEI
jgi:peptidoglycan/xylan/chitin deacetylase (PgdA/CDA1 family)